LRQEIVIPDTSFYSGKVDHAKMKAAGATGVIIRVGQRNYADSMFTVYWRDAKTAGLLRGGYWFYDSRAEPVAQAAYFVSLIKDDMPEMEVWLDYEENYGGQWSGWRNFAVFAGEVKRLLSVNTRIGIYTGYYYWMEHSPNPSTESASFQWFEQFPLWLAWYSPAEVVKIPAPWTTALYWQFTATGDGPKYGTQSLGLDLSYFQGSMDDFNARYGMVTTPPVTTDLVKLVSVTDDTGVTVKEKLHAFVVVNTIPWELVIDQRPVIVPPPPPPPLDFPHLYRIKSDPEAGVEPVGTRPYIRNGLPCTVRMQGVASSVSLTPAFIALAYAINTGKARNYMFSAPDTLKPAVGWHNQGGANRVETVVFGGNVVEVLRVEGTRAYIRTLVNGDTPPAPAFPMDGKNPVFENFSIQYTNRLDISTDGRYARVFPICNPGEQPWIDIRDLIRL
jgi:GH25 family lysozyme M1 (1,4-beta-N-acetylmuramidase)